MNKILFWDFDGTLSYPNKSFNTALHVALCEAGYTIDFNEAAEFIGQAYSWKTPHVVYNDKCGALWWDSLFEKIDSFCEDKGVRSSDFNKIHKCFKERLVDVSNYELYDDTEETLKKCVSLGYKNYLITNNYPEILTNIEKLGLSPYFTDFVVSSHIGYEKPVSGFFDYAKNLAGDCDAAYVIGDNPVADIQGGKDAGFGTIAVHECKESNADYYIEKLSQIFVILS